MFSGLLGGTKEESKRKWVFGKQKKRGGRSGKKRTGKAGKGYVRGDKRGDLLGLLGLKFPNSVPHEKFN